MFQDRPGHVQGSDLSGCCQAFASPRLNQKQALQMPEQSRSVERQANPTYGRLMFWVAFAHGHDKARAGFPDDVIFSFCGKFNGEFYLHHFESSRAYVCKRLPPDVQRSWAKRRLFWALVFLHLKVKIWWINAVNWVLRLCRLMCSAASRMLANNLPFVVIRASLIIWSKI